jgi:hypothetical protein
MEEFRQEDAAKQIQKLEAAEAACDFFSEMVMKSLGEEEERLRQSRRSVMLRLVAAALDDENVDYDQGTYEQFEEGLALRIAYGTGPNDQRSVYCIVSDAGIHLDVHAAGQEVLGLTDQEALDLFDAVWTLSYSRAERADLLRAYADGDRPISVTSDEEA